VLREAKSKLRKTELQLSCTTSKLRLKDKQWNDEMASVVAASQVASDMRVAKRDDKHAQAMEKKVKVRLIFAILACNVNCTLFSHCCSSSSIFERGVNLALYENNRMHKNNAKNTLSGIKVKHADEKMAIQVKHSAELTTIQAAHAKEKKRLDTADKKKMKAEKKRMQRKLDMQDRIEKKRLEVLLGKKNLMHSKEMESMKEEMQVFHYTFHSLTDRMYCSTHFHCSLSLPHHRLLRGHPQSMKRRHMLPCCS
jgi:hypothetical protein